MMTNARNAKNKQINTQHANRQNESINTNKSTICQALLSWKMLNLKSKRMHENTTKVIEDWSTSSPNREKGEVMCHGGMCQIKEGDDQALVK